MPKNKQMFNVDIHILGDILTVVARQFSSKFPMIFYAHCYPGWYDPKWQQFLWKLSVLGNAHSLNMVMTIPLKTSSQHFTLHKLIVLPTRVSESKFIEYVHDFTYLALSFNQRDFALLKEADLLHCSTGMLTVCPLNVPLYDSKVPACEAQLYFQMSEEKPACRRRLLINHRTPILYRHGTSWFFHFPEKRQVSIRCPQGSGWITLSEVLSETGVIHNATACTIAAGEIRTLPELHGTAEVRTDIPKLYLPDIPPMLSVHEEPGLKEMTSPETEELDGIKSRLATPPKFWDFDTLLHIQQATVQHADHTH